MVYVTSQQLSLSVDGVNIAAELYPAAGQAEAPAVVVCHGLPAGNVADPDDPGYPGLAGSLQAEGFSTLIFNFRGCGQSGGDLDAAAWRRDLSNAVDYVAGTLRSSLLFIVGFSAGAATSVSVAAQDPRVDAVALLACPASFNSLRREENARALLEQCRRVGTIRDPAFPPSLKKWGAGFVEASPERWIARISPRPVLIVHGEADDVVPVQDARRLYAKAGEPKELVLLPALGHRLRRQEAAMALLISWLKRQASDTKA